MAKIAKRVQLKIRRKDSPDKQNYWEEFEVSYRPEMTVIGALEEIQRNPVNKDGDKTTPVVWSSCCHEEMCGACTMIINGRVRLACSTKIIDLGHPVVLEPMTKFPVIRDLWVDRSSMFDTLKKVATWNRVDGYYDNGLEPLIHKKDQEKFYSYTTCIMCGACLEACPQYNERSPFMGAHVLGQVLATNSHPVGALNSDDRLDAIMGIGGLSECGNAGNCSEVCPKEIPLTDAIARLGWATTIRAFKKICSE